MPDQFIIYLYSKTHNNIEISYFNSCHKYSIQDKYSYNLCDNYN